MMFVLLAALLLSMVTLSVMRLVAGDITEGFGGLEAVQAFNVAEAGVHYAIGQLETGTAGTYAGEAITIKSGATTLGTATITVNCLDGGSPSPTPCAGGYPAYRRIISTSTLPTGGGLGGPTRTIVAVVQGTGGGGGATWPGALCALSTVADFTSGGDTTTINGDIYSNGGATLNPSGATVKIQGGSGYTGQVTAVTTIACTGPACTAAGGLHPGQAGPLCSAPTMPTFTPGATNVTVTPDATYWIPSTGGSFNNITLNTGTCSGVSSMTTLSIDSGTAGHTTVVQLNSLIMGSTLGACTRLMVTGSGNVDLRIAAATGLSLDVGTHHSGADPAHFGVGPTDTLSATAPIVASRLTVWVNSNGSGSGLVCDTSTSCATWMSHTSGSATIIAPNGTVQIDDSNLPDPMFGAVMAKQVNLSGGGIYTTDMSGASGFSGSGAYSNFNTLKSWKDQ